MKPYFTKCPSQSLRIPENTETGAKLITVVRAADNDRLIGETTKFGEIEYSIKPDVFSIDANSGRIFLERD